MSIEIDDLCKRLLPHKICQFFSFNKSFRCWNIRRTSSTQGEYIQFDVSYLTDSYNYFGRTDEYQEAFSGHIILKTFKEIPTDEELMWPFSNREENSAIIKFAPKYPDDWFEKIWEMKEFYAQFLVSESVLELNWGAFMAKFRDDKAVIFRLPNLMPHHIKADFLRVDNDENEFVVGVDRLQFCHQLGVLALNPEVKSIHR